MDAEKTHDAVDLSHHLSDLAKARKMSPLKGLQKYMGREHMIAFAGGLPSPDYFPFAAVGGDALVADSFALAPAAPLAPPSPPLAWLWRLLGSAPRAERTARIAVPKAPRAGDGGLNLATALQYGPATGMPALQAFVQAFSARVFRPAHAGFATLVHTGNTDGWSRCVMTLCNRGDTIIAEEWTYPSALASAGPVGVGVLPVAMDGEGMRADSLRELLEGWDASRGRRPHVMYTVPVGQNPCGATMQLARKKQIYDICVEFDVVIVEDDPYFFLQVDEYVPKADRKAAPEASAQDEAAHFIDSLAPSYLRVDYQGRVIRLDTFSKTIAPGVRLGWFTCNSMFAERLERQGETSTQSPCGLGQALVTKLLSTWKYEGYIRWLRGLRMQYQLRRDLFVDLLAEEFELVQAPGTRAQGAWHGRAVYTAYPKRSPPARGLLSFGEKAGAGGGAVRRPLFSFVPPAAGMFVWVKLHFAGRVRRGGGDEDDDEEMTQEMRLWTALAEAGVLTAPGWFFAADQEDAPTDPDVEGHMRMSFSSAEPEEMRKGVAIFAKTLKEFFRE